METNMALRSRKKNNIKHLGHAIRAPERVIASLESLGFELERQEVLFHEARPRLKVDLVFRRGDEEYAVEAKFSRKMHLGFMHLLPRAILRLQAVNRHSRLLPIVAISVPRLDPRDIKRMMEYMDFYAPEVGWLLLDEEGRGVFHDLENDQFAILIEGEVERIDSPLSAEPSLFQPVGEPAHDRFQGLEDSIYRSFSNSSLSWDSMHSSINASSSSWDSNSSSLNLYLDPNLGSSKSQLSFNDLDQWLLKVFILSPLDIASDYWGGPSGHAENAFQLSKIADVSPTPANLWVKAMESSGYLKRFGRKGMILRRPRAILEEWVGRYRFSDNRLYPYRSIYPVSDYDEFFEEILGKIKRHKKELEPLGIAAHQACKLYGIKHSSARSIHVYFLGNVEKVAKVMDLVPSEEQEKADLFLVEPRYPKSVFGGILQKKGIPVCDIMQCYVDLYHLPDRGREQADLINEDVISRIIRMR